MLGTLLSAVKERGPLLFLQSFQDFHFTVGLGQRLAAQLELLSDQLPPLVDAADARQKLTTVVAPGRGAVDSDVSLATQSADLCELLFALGDQLLPLGDQVRVVSQNLAKSRWQWSRRFLRNLSRAASEKTKPFTV